VRFSLMIVYRANNGEAGVMERPLPGTGGRCVQRCFDAAERLPFRHSDDVRAFPPDDLKRTCVATEKAQTAFNIFGRFSR
jgi:hypothetical protein